MSTVYSGHQLIPHLNVLQNLYLHQKGLPDEQHQTLFYDLELLPYTLGLCWHSVSELARIQDELSRSVPDEAFKEATIVGLGVEARDRMTFAVDAFLDAARRSQNAVIHYLRHGLGAQFPMSLSRLVKGVLAGSLQLPARAQDGVLKYWKEHGKRLKDYRDLSQHHALVSSDARLFRSSAGQRALYFTLPSNPEAKVPALLRFGAPSVHAFPYVLNEFLALVAILHWLTRGLVPQGLTARMAMVVFRDGLKLDMSGHIVPTVETVQAEITMLREALQRPRPAP